MPTAQEHDLEAQPRAATSKFERTMGFQDTRGPVSWTMNIIWAVFFGFVGFLLWVLGGIVLCITIVGIPCGYQCFKISKLALFPFGRSVTRTGDEFKFPEIVGNILWLPFGLIIALHHLILAVSFAVTIIGIPFAYQHVKLMYIAVCPFGVHLSTTEIVTHTTTTRVTGA
jgi:uncharacterized membrane protein YccF (DUF307 family)